MRQPRCHIDDELAASPSLPGQLRERSCLDSTTRTRFSSGSGKLFLLAFLTGLAVTGCQSSMVSRATKSVESEESDKSDAWVHRAGDVARTEHSLEEVHDPLGLRKYFMSEKAREIERNVGIGD